MRNLTDRTVGRIPQTLVTRESTITAADVRAYRVRNPQCGLPDSEVRALILASYTCDLGFATRDA